MKKINASFAVLALVALVGFSVPDSFGGSRDIDNWEQQNAGQIDTIEKTADMIGGALAPVTGGWSSILVKAAGSIFGAFMFINRTIAAHKRKRVIEEVDRNPETPSVAQQVATLAAIKTVKAMPSIL